jgi:hypothetical protein
VATGSLTIPPDLKLSGKLWPCKDIDTKLGRKFLAEIGEILANFRMLLKIHLAGASDLHHIPR